jgi:nicotinamidase-related amidase
MNTTDTTHRKGLVGASPNNNFWLYDSKTGFDLTHPETPSSPPLSPRLTLSTTTLPITISPPKTALVIIDMQNFFLSPDLGRPSDSKGLQAQSQLLQHAIPAARAAGIRIIWLNWGLTDEDLQTMPPATFRAFGFETVPASDFPEAFTTSPSRNAAVDSHGVNELAPQISRDQDRQTESSGKNPRIYRGLGSEIGPVTLASGESVPGGRLLFRESWNAALTPELDAAWEKGRKLDEGTADVWLHKNRMSGLWGQTTDATEWIDREGIRTLIFAGVNTDVSVFLIWPRLIQCFPSSSNSFRPVPH